MARRLTHAVFFPVIVTVTLNPTLDKTLSVARLQAGAVHRARFIRQDLGGKGINVSRALGALGVSSRIVAFLGGSIGRTMQAGLLAEGFDVTCIEVEGETRQNLTLLDEATGLYTKINEPGPMVHPQQVAMLRERVASTVRPGDIWVFSGSLPPGAPDDLYAGLIRSVQDAGGRAFLDTSGPALRAGLQARPYAIKPNSEEAAEVLERPVQSDEEHSAAARLLRQAGCYTVCLSRGARGLFLAAGTELVRAEPPPVQARSPVGAGDAALAGLVWAAVDGCDAVEMARRAAACGTAAAMQEGTGMGALPLIQELMGQTQITRLLP